MSRNQETVSTSRVSGLPRRRRARSLECPIWLVLLLIGSGGCATSEPKPAFSLNAAAFREQVHTLCVFPVRYSIPLPADDERRKAFPQELLEPIEGVGYAVVGSELVQALWERERDVALGAYDPHTGRRDEARFEEIRARFRAAMASELGCDATLAVTVATVTADFANGVASWDGAEQSAGSQQAASGKWGYTTALSLWVVIEDLAGEELYFHTGGVQLLSRVELDRGKPVFRELVPHLVFSDAIRRRAAIRLALEPLTGGWEPPRSTKR